MSQYVFTMTGVSKTVAPKRTILKDISLSFIPGAKIGVLGLNGSGKSSLLKIIAGIDKEIDGTVKVEKDIEIGYLAQEPMLDESETVRANVEAGIAKTKALLDEFNEISCRFAEPMSDDEMARLLDQQAELQNQIEALGAWDVERKLEMASDALRLPAWDTTVSSLSGGEKRRVALCKLLLSNPDVLLLDEPTNHLDAESVAWLEQFLEKYPGTVIAVTHDRYFLDNVAEWILELDRGEGIPFKGNYTAWLSQKEARLEQEGREEKAHQRAVKAELEWVRQNPKGRHAKNKARIHRFEELNSREFQKRQETNEIYIPPGERLGELVLEVNHLQKRFNEKFLFDDLNLLLPAGSILGVIGANGAGKSTFLKLITGQLEPDEGSIRLGKTVQLSYVDQHRDHLDDKNSVWQEVSDGLDLIQVGRYEMASRAYVSRFNFKGSDQQKLIGNLSGGERNRVHLAKLLKRGGNVLLLDEPSNDLDVETLRALEEGLMSFPGSAIVVSHDRWFLDRICTHILAFEGDSKVTFYEGNYSDYEEDRKKRLGDVASPKRLKYRPLMD
jgi:ATP-binding cassette ChvD family protein